MQHPGWALLFSGLVIAAIGVIWLPAPHVPWLGKLPGDIAVEGKNVRFYFPIVTCIVLSLLRTGIMWLVRFFSRCDPRPAEPAVSPRESENCRKAALSPLSFDLVPCIMMLSRES